MWQEQHRADHWHCKENWKRGTEHITGWRSSEWGDEIRPGREGAKALEKWTYNRNKGTEAGTIITMVSATNSTYYVLDTAPCTFTYSISWNSYKAFLSPLRWEMGSISNIPEVTRLQEQDWTQAAWLLGPHHHPLHWGVLCNYGMWAVRSGERRAQKERGPEKQTEGNWKRPLGNHPLTF